MFRCYLLCVAVKCTVQEALIYVHKTDLVAHPVKSVVTSALSTDCGAEIRMRYSILALKNTQHGQQFH